MDGRTVRRGEGGRPTPSPASLSNSGAGGAGKSSKRAAGERGRAEGAATAGGRAAHVLHQTFFQLLFAGLDSTAAGLGSPRVSSSNHHVERPHFLAVLASSSLLVSAAAVAAASFIRIYEIIR